jgi:HD-GYP domain-containing protein (c-di-GMP phosphodiesterase class II)
METPPVRNAKRYPLHVTISVAFTALLAIFGVAIIAFNYLESREMALVGAEDLLDRVDDHMRISVAGLYGPVENVIDVASKTLPENSDSADQGVRSLGFASEVLRIKHDIAAIFVGYEDGDFYLLRRVAAWPNLGETVEVPEGATFVLQSIERKGKPPVGQDWYFYDDDLALVGKATTAWGGLDPRERDWYRLAMSSDGQVASEFYRFFTTGEIGVTIARRLPGRGGVVGADLTLKGLSAGLARQNVTESTRIAMLNPDGSVIALPDLGRELAAMESRGDGGYRMPHLTDLDDPVYHELAAHLDDAGTGRTEIEVEDRTWRVSFSELPTRWGEPIILASAVPRDELLAEVIAVRNKSVLISVALLAVALLVVVAVSRHVSRSLRTLALEAEHIRELRLDTPLTVRSRIREVDDLAATMELMKDSLQQFLTISQALSAEKNFRRLLETILEETRRVSGAEGGAILLQSEDETRLDVAILQRSTTEDADHDAEVPPVALERDLGAKPAVEVRTVATGEVVRVDDAGRAKDYDLGRTRERFEDNGASVRSVMSVPLKNPQDEIIGVLQLVNARGRQGHVVPFRDEIVPYIEALSSSAAVALDNRRLLKAQRDLMDSFIHVVAGAIDAKSPYTHGHCQRVPVLARMLAEAAHESADGPFASFRLTDDEWYTLHLASWLHDCGKVTTPEYVVDKATKLETLYDRLHEIRMRFEVLWRDAEIDYFRALAAGEDDEATLRRRRDECQAQIRDDFGFIAECNAGEVPMSDERIDRVRSIAEQSWVRHLDDRVGLSHGEQKRKGIEPPAELPATEKVLADKPEHVIPRSDGGHPFGNNQHGFRMDVPANLYNLGEVHNLCIRRGTLTDEERFKINEHVIQTIRMLGRLPFPRELRKVPDWAGNHHEKLDGTGYPRRLPAEALTIPERIMAMADIFEALTATDRPYMPPKTLSRAIGIMRSMRDGGHLCPDLFELLLKSEVYRRYADENLQPSQLDEVNVDEILGSDAA